jgi:hypothetical protein
MPTLDPEKLKPLLGQTLRYQGIPCQVIEILADPPALVLQGRQQRKVIQPTQYGDAGDWIAETFTVALLNSRRDGFNPDLPELAGFDLLL